MVWDDLASGMIPLVWYNFIGMVWFHWYGMIPWVWYGFIGMVCFYLHGIIPLVWYASVCMVYFHSYGIIPLLWYDSIGLVCFSLSGIIPFLWYHFEHIWHKEILAVRQIGQSSVPTEYRRAYQSMIWKEVVDTFIPPLLPENLQSCTFKGECQ